LSHESNFIKIIIQAAELFWFEPYVVVKNKPQLAPL